MIGLLKFSASFAVFDLKSNILLIPSVHLYSLKHTSFHATEHKRPSTGGYNQYMDKPDSPCFFWGGRGKCQFLYKWPRGEKGGTGYIISEV